MEKWEHLENPRYGLKQDKFKWFYFDPITESSDHNISIYAMIKSKYMFSSLCH
jgi:hypothetical protein